MGGSAAALGVEHVFVLMLENRSFDHLLGFSGITGSDAVTGQSTAVNGLTGAESNSWNGKVFPAIGGADNVMPADPPHEFLDVLHQLCGASTKYSGGPYPKIDHSGFVASYAAAGGSANPGEILKCYLPGQLPVLHALAREFAVCDNWYSSLPGPTWPNRMFAHAASSAGLDHSPSTLEIVRWETVDGFGFRNGTIFDALQQHGLPRRLYGGDDFPMVAALKGIHLDDIRHYSLFATDVAAENYPDRYIFIEPSYDVLHDYRNGTSQHPLGDVRRGEILIKATYEAVRNSPLWETSLLIITWDEHGGFFDHAIPPGAIAPGDTAAGSEHNRYGFGFDQYGVRVPAVVVSPRIPKNVIDHRLYDHASIAATLEHLFALHPLTARDAAANGVESLLTLTAARDDTPETLPEAAGGELLMPRGAIPPATEVSLSRPEDSADQGNLPAIVYSALQQELRLSPDDREEIVARVAAITNRAQAAAYLERVQARIHPERSTAAPQ